MSSPPGGGMMDNPTKQDLKDLSDNIKEHINLLIAPIIKEQESMATILIGKTKINGLVGTQKTMKIELKVVYGLLIFVGAGLVKLIFFH